jgi:hypothetical protein
MYSNSCRVYKIMSNKKFCGDLTAYFSLIRQGPHRKRHLQQFFYGFLYIRCRGNVFNESFPSNARGIDIQTHRLMGGIYEVRRWDGLRCHDIHNKFHKDWFTHTHVDGGGADLQINRQHGNLISLLLLFQNKENRLKRSLISILSF